MNAKLLRSSCAIAAVLATVGLAACADDDDDAVRTARYEAPSPAVRDAQARLQTLGYYGGPVDGLWGPDTRDSLRRFQHDRDLAETARLDDETTAVLYRTPTRQAAPPRTVRDDYPLEPRVVRGVQVRLQRLGFYHGSTDGIWGAETQDALTAFQKSRGLQPSGALTPTTASMLGLNPNDLRASTAGYSR